MMETKVLNIFISRSLRTIRGFGRLVDVFYLKIKKFHIPLILNVLFHQANKVFCGQ